MTRSERLQRIVTLADSAKRTASQRLAGSRRTRDDERERLVQFEQYRDDYLTTLAAGGKTMSAAQARELRQFIVQVEQAIRALRAQLANAEQQYCDDVAGWNSESQRTSALCDVLKRARRKDAQVEENEAQREIDDRAGMRAGRT